MKAGPKIAVGKKFGWWEVLENNVYKVFPSGKSRACRVRCTVPGCKTISILTYGHLKTGHSVSCGCNLSELQKHRYKVSHPLIPVGTKFGWWEVLENDLYKVFPTMKSRACRVRCTGPGCSTIAIRTYGELRCGRSPSCGCKSKERDIETVWRDLHAKISRRGWDFHLTLPELKLISELPCAYCGKEPSNVHRVKYKVGGVYKRIVDASLEIRYTGIDRVDSTRGYIHGNVVPCCGECNGMKSNYALDEFFALFERIQSRNPTAAKIRAQAATLFGGIFRDVPAD